MYSCSGGVKNAFWLLCSHKKARRSNMNITEKLILLRKSKGISQEELAEKLDVSRQAISRWETGTALPDANNILALSKLW